MASHSSSPEIHLPGGLQTEIDKLKQTLSKFKGLSLKSDENKAQHQVGLAKLPDLLYDAEDVLDDVEIEALRRRVEKSGSFRQDVRIFFSRSNSIASNFKFAHKIKSIRERLDVMEATIESSPRLVNSRERRTDHSFVGTTHVFGRDDDKGTIINLLMTPNKDGHVSVVPIVGIGGMGKTTLAKMVYSDKRIVEHFDLKMWVNVPKDFDVIRLMKETYTSATYQNSAEFIDQNAAEFIDQNSAGLTIDQLYACLKKTLAGRKFLLVLDNVKNENKEKWDKFRNLLTGSADGSKIMVTTRSEQVANIMGTVPTFVLRALSHEDCRKLFIELALRDGAETSGPDLLTIENEIVNKCGGIPLAVRILGSLLYQTTSVSDRSLISNHEIWRQEEERINILPILNLSYDHLPFHLQRCFAYCSLFPEDYHFNSDCLIHCWMAVGLISTSNQNEELEEIGLSCLKELFSRCFFEEVEDHGYYFTFKMHDLIRDLAMQVAQRECLVVDYRSPDVDTNVRHFSFINSENCDGVLELLKIPRNVRTIIFSSLPFENVTESFFNTFLSNLSKFKYLRLLFLSGPQFVLLPDSVGSLKYLKYLDLSWNLILKKLTDAICKLQSLQTLRLLGCSAFEKLPQDMQKMISLRCLEVPTKEKHLPQNGIEYLSSLRYLHLRDCRHLETLPDMKSLTSLRTLILQGCHILSSLPRSIKYLQSLEKLVLYNCPKLNLKMDLEGDEDLRLKLKVFMIYKLQELLDLPQVILQRSDTTLEYMRIEACPNFTALPAWLPHLTSLQKLDIVSCPGLSDLPIGMHNLTALGELKIQKSPALIEFVRQNKESFPFRKIQLDSEIISSIEIE